MTESMFPDLPDPVPPAETERVSAGRRLTERRLALVQAGYHPLANVVPRLRLHANSELRCGSCANLLRHRRNREYIKCSMHPSHSDASDVRVSWRACIYWKESEQ